ncbi:hypothetical protein BHE74_00052496 [Ensete ventricosum]|nr:hypothetical protein GW17_00048914 [Ensete ventricosum]RWW41985.1 hypothetical protein BHE74_00052496 [Ensete ventricosum]
MGWISHAEGYFHYYRISKDFMVDINHLEEDVIQWYNWLEYTHGAPTWIQFKNVLLNRFGSMKYENIDSQLTKIRQTSTIQEYQTSFKNLFYLACDWTDRQLLGPFIEGLKPEIKGKDKARQPHTITTVISFARIQEEWVNQDARRMRTTPRPATYKPSAPPAPNCTLLPKKLKREELRDRSAKGLCWHCNELWSHNYHCKKGKFYMIEPIRELEEEDLEPEEEDSQRPIA